MWNYVQRTGELSRNGIRLSTGYSGSGLGKNNPDQQDIHDVGPIPTGEWEICGPPYNTMTHGPYILRLEPKPGTATFGRVGFLMHGDSLVRPGEASKGCIIMGRIARTKVWESGDHDLLVTAEQPLPTNSDEETQA